jgi:hypothetical protein
MNNPDYARKYPQHTNHLGRIAKQAFDARFLEGRSGHSFGAIASTSRGGYEHNVVTLPRSWFERRIGFTVYGGDVPRVGAQLQGALRVQTPSRLGVYAQVAMSIGYAWEADDGIDNDKDGVVDEWCEADMMTIGGHPEVGVHYWIKTNLRLAGHIRHNVLARTDRPEHEHTTIGFSLTYLFGPEPTADFFGPYETADPYSPDGIAEPTHRTPLEDPVFPSPEMIPDPLGRDIVVPLPPTTAKQIPPPVPLTDAR